MSSGNEASRSRGDDRVLPATRVVAVVVLPFLLMAVLILFAFPSRTGALFAWQIDLPLSAFMLASAYVGGIWFFARVTVTRRWHRIRHGFPAVVVFAGALLVATLLHLDKFSANVSFYTWIALYATTPVAAALLLVAQRRSDPGTPDPVDVDIPAPLRWGLVAIGLVSLGFGAAMFIWPTWAIEFWAWPLTPLTARVTGAVLSLTGVVNVALLWDSRWSAFRILFQAQLVSLVAIVVSVIARRDDLLWDRPMAFVFLMLIGCALVVYGGFTLRNEFLMRRAAAAIPARR